MSFLHSSIFYVHLVTFFRVAYLNVIKYPSLSRFLPTFFFLGVLLLFWIVLLVGRLLDEILFIGYRKIDLKNPFFIISNPRSGTTFLHGLISLDKERFVHMKLYHALFPSISILKLINLIGVIDNFIGSPLKWLLDKIENKLFDNWQKIHPLGFNKPEEDEPIFILAMVTPVYFLLCPFVKEIDYLKLMDNIDEESKEKMMNYYENSLKRLVYVIGKDKVLLTKNALASGRIKSFYKRFPSANYVYIYRNPGANISSLVSILEMAWKAHSPLLLKDSIYLKQIALMGVDFYKHFLNSSRKINTDRLLTINFDELIVDPYKQIELIYNYFNIEMVPTYKKTLKEKIAAQKKYKSKHIHALDNCGITQKDLKNIMPEVYKHYK